MLGAQPYQAGRRALQTSRSSFADMNEAMGALRRLHCPQTITDAIEILNPGTLRSGSRSARLYCLLCIERRFRDGHGETSCVKGAQRAQ
jgi:hypothetical protein